MKVVNHPPQSFEGLNAQAKKSVVDFIVKAIALYSDHAEESLRKLQTEIPGLVDNTESIASNVVSGFSDLKLQGALNKPFNNHKVAQQRDRFRCVQANPFLRTALENHFLQGPDAETEKLLKKHWHDREGVDAAKADQWIVNYTAYLQTKDKLDSADFRTVLLGADSFGYFRYGLLKNPNLDPMALFDFLVDESNLSLKEQLACVANLVPQLTVNESNENVFFDKFSYVLNKTS